MLVIVFFFASYSINNFSEMALVRILSQFFTILCAGGAGGGANNESVDDLPCTPDDEDINTPYPCPTCNKTIKGKVMLQAHHFQVFYALQNFKLLDNSHLAQEFQLTIPALIFLGTLREPGASGYGRGRQARVSCLPQTVHPKL